MSSKLAKRSLEPKEGLAVLKLKVLFLVVVGLGVVLEMMGMKPNSSLGVVLRVDFVVGLLKRRLLVEEGRVVVMNRGPGRPPRGLTFRPFTFSDSEKKKKKIMIRPI